ncbi:MAG: hypothetical protein ACK40O_10715 [Allosphingosinicella sp.]
MPSQSPAAAATAADLQPAAVPAAWPSPVADAAAPPAPANDPTPPPPFAATAAVAEIPAGVLRIVAGAYAGLIVLFFALFANSPVAFFAITVCAFLVGAFFTIPHIFLKIEAAPGRKATFAGFMQNGVATLTGRSGGGDALVQMLIVPVLLTLGLGAMGIIGKVFIG